MSFRHSTACFWSTGTTGGRGEACERYRLAKDRWQTSVNTPLRRSTYSMTSGSGPADRGVLLPWESSSSVLMLSQDDVQQLPGWCCGRGSHPVDRSVKECQECARHQQLQGSAPSLATVNSSPDAARISGLEVALRALFQFLVGMQVSLSLSLKAASHALSRDHKSQPSYGFCLGNTLMILMVGFINGEKGYVGRNRSIHPGLCSVGWNHVLIDVIR